MSRLLAVLLALPALGAEKAARVSLEVAPVSGALSASAPAVPGPILTLTPQGPSFIAPAASADAAAARPSIDASDFEHVMFDVRGARGGHGDVAAAYLTASDLLQRAGGTAPDLTFVADKAALKILGRLEGRQLFDGEAILGGRARVFRAASLPPDLAPADAVLRLAARSAGDKPFTALPMRPDGVELVQSVLGNTEAYMFEPARATAAGRTLALPNAGVRPDQAGVYADPVALSLRGKTPDEVRRFLLKEIPHDAPGALGIVRSFLRGNALEGAEASVAYTGDLWRTHREFRDYVSGLEDRALREDRSFLFLTPSPVNAEMFKGKRFKGRVVFLEPGKAPPRKAQPGKVYVLGTGFVRHATMVGLLKYSATPVVFDGDGVLSAAIGMGQTFAMTPLPWNTANVAAVRRRLVAEAKTPEARETLKAVFATFKERRLDRAQELAALAPLFAKLSDSVPLLTDWLLAAVRAARKLASPQEPVARLLDGVEAGPREALLAHRALGGDAEARRLASRQARSKDAAGRRLMQQALVRDVALRHSLAGVVLRADWAPLNAVVARAALLTAP